MENFCALVGEFLALCKPLAGILQGEVQKSFGAVLLPADSPFSLILIPSVFNNVDCTIRVVAKLSFPVTISGLLFLRKIPKTTEFESVLNRNQNKIEIGKRRWLEILFVSRVN